MVRRMALRPVRWPGGLSVFRFRSRVGGRFFPPQGITPMARRTEASTRRNPHAGAPGATCIRAGRHVDFSHTRVQFQALTRHKHILITIAERRRARTFPDAGRQPPAYRVGISLHTRLLSDRAVGTATPYPEGCVYTLYIVYDCTAV